MIKTIPKIGDSQGGVFDSALPPIGEAKGRRWGECGSAIAWFDHDHVSCSVCDWGVPSCWVCSASHRKEGDLFRCLSS